MFLNSYGFNRVRLGTDNRTCSERSERNSDCYTNVSIAPPARVQVANIVCRQLKNCRKSVAVTKKRRTKSSFVGTQCEIPVEHLIF